MLYWLIYEIEESIDCEDVPFTLHVVTSDIEPPNSVNGPFEDIADAFAHMQEHLVFDEQGRTHLK